MTSLKKATVGVVFRLNRTAPAVESSSELEILMET